MNSKSNDHTTAISNEAEMGVITESRKLIHLSQKDSEVFFEAVENPPQANQKLKNALANYKQKIG